MRHASLQRKDSRTTDSRLILLLQQFASSSTVEAGLWDDYDEDVPAADVTIAASSTESLDELLNSYLLVRCIARSANVHEYWTCSQ
jgi:hypothetical protein